MPSDWICAPGSTLLIPSGAEGHHLFIILNEPKDFEGYLNSSVLVDICTIRRGPYDNTCEIQSGSHPFIANQSYVAYRHARIERHEGLIAKVNSKFFIPNEPVDGDLLKRIQEGLLKSPQTPNFLKNFTFD